MLGFWRGSLLWAGLCAVVTPGPASASGKGSLPPTQPQISDGSAGSVLHSNSSAAHWKASAGPDTFALYGGPGSLLGKFQNAQGGMDAQGWIGVDATESMPEWQRSTFRSPTGTTAMWSGFDASQESGWSTAPGYGNGWNALLTYTRTPTDPSVGQTVNLSFVFHHDLEPGFDFFIVEYDLGTTVRTVMSRSGRTIAPLQFPADVTVLQPIVFAGNDYGTEGKITIRLRVTSDVAWSDEDGLYPSDGAAQVDDITVSGDGFSDFEDFEQPSTLWKPQYSPYAGNFAKIFFRMTDLDPCAENTTPFAAFIDDGTPPSNPSYDGPGTGGSLSPTWDYGIPGGWVIPYHGGISQGSLQFHNEWWSPEIEWDLPGGLDDGPDVAGAQVRFDIWRHMPLLYDNYYFWAVRSRDTATGLWTDWRDNGFVYVSSDTRWRNEVIQLGHLLEAGIDRVQFRIAAEHRDIQWFPPDDATPAPCFDNVSVQKYRIGGPSIVVAEQDLFADTFAGSGLTDVSTQAARDLLDCRVDMARSITAGGASIPIRSGDSLAVTVHSLLSGVSISDPASQIRLRYSLNLNPLFEAAIRPNAPITGSGGLYGWNQSEGFVGATQVLFSNGTPIADRFAFDLPDEGFLYPGDVLEYYIEAVDDDGRTSTLPENLSGYDDGPSGAAWDPRFQVRALPSYANPNGAHPDLLVWNDAADPDALAALQNGLAENGLIEGVHFDLYTTRAATALVDNGLGSASPNGRGHGATLSQLSGYSCIVHEASDRSTALLSDGSDLGLNDKSNDIGLLQSWFDLPSERYIAHFGDNLAYYLGRTGSGGSGSPTQLAYLANVMGVSLLDGDVRDEIDQQTAPHVLPTGSVPAFTRDFVAYGGCPMINGFDSIAPLAGAVAGHGFEVAGAAGTSYPIGPGRAASVVWDRTVNVAGSDYRKVSVSFPYGMHYVYGTPFKGSATALGHLLAATLGLFADHFGGLVDAPQSRVVTGLTVAPNPFNPRTRIRFSTQSAGVVELAVFDARGALVRTLHAAELPAGDQDFLWDGQDQDGHPVASGVYILRLLSDSRRETQKLALVR